MTTPTNWAEANQRALVAELAVVRAALRRHAGEADTPTADAARRAELAARAALPAMSALDHLAGVFGLSAFERAVLVLCAGIELDAGVAADCAAAQGDGHRPYPTFGLALAALPDSHWSALTPDAPLRYWRLVEPAAGPVLTAAPVRIDERVLHLLAGVPGLDERLAGLVEAVPPGSVSAWWHRPPGLCCDRTDREVC
ncbi:MAG: hypothetical protein K2X87_15445, partial [Gemmataceae bacterium]|nr:hypothetical protein [Gemmataceae bacterium]